MCDCEKYPLIHCDKHEMLTLCFRRLMNILMKLKKTQVCFVFFLVLSMCVVKFGSVGLGLKVLFDSSKDKSKSVFTCTVFSQSDLSKSH